MFNNANNGYHFVTFTQWFNGSGQSAEVEVLAGYTEASLERVLRSVCSGQPVSLFSLPEHLDRANTTDNHHQLLSFLKQRSNIFHISSSPFGHMVSLIDDTLRNVEDDVDAGHTEAEDRNALAQDDHVTDRSDVAAPDHIMFSLSSHLQSVLSEAGGSLSLDRLEWDEVCVAEFASQADLVQYLCQQPHFTVWDSEVGKMVSFQPTGLRFGASASASASSGSRWGRARQAEGAETLPVTPEHVKIEEEQRSADSFQERRFTDWGEYSFQRETHFMDFNISDLLSVLQELRFHDAAPTLRREPIQEASVCSVFELQTL